jgi:hypothetical protein
MIDEPINLRHAMERRSALAAGRAGRSRERHSGYTAVLVVGGWTAAQKGVCEKPRFLLLRRQSDFLRTVGRLSN